MDTEDKKEKIKKKQDTITALDKDEDYAVEKFDTLIVSLSSGGLVFSVAFVKDVIKDFKHTDLFWLKICWICFALALIANISSQVSGYFSNRYEKRALKCQIKQLKGSEEIDEWGAQKRIANFQNKSDRFNLLTNRLNGFSYLSFITAVCTLIYFIYSHV